MGTVRAARRKMVDKGQVTDDICGESDSDISAPTHGTSTGGHTLAQHEPSMTPPTPLFSLAPVLLDSTLWTTLEIRLTLNFSLNNSVLVLLQNNVNFELTPGHHSTPHHTTAKLAGLLRYSAFYTE